MADSLWTSLDMAKSNMRRIESRLNKYLDSEKTPLLNQKSLGYVKPAFQTPSRHARDILVPFSSERAVGLLRSGSKSGERGFQTSTYQKHQTDTLRGLFSTPLRMNQSSLDKQAACLHRAHDLMDHQYRYSKSAEIGAPFYRTFDAKLAPSLQQGSAAPNIRDTILQNRTLPSRAYLEAVLPTSHPCSYKQPSAKDRISAQISRTATAAYPTRPYRDFSWQDPTQHPRISQPPNATVLLGQEISRKLLSAQRTTNLMTRFNEIKDNSQFLKTKIDQANLIFSLSTAGNNPLQTESSRFGSTILHNLMGSRKIARESRRSVAESMLGGKHAYLPDTMSTYESRNAGGVGTQTAWTVHGTPESAGRVVNDQPGSNVYHQTESRGADRPPRTTDRTNIAAQSGDEMGLRNASRDPSKPSTPTRAKTRDDREFDDRIASHTNTARVAEEIRKHKASLKARGNRVSELFHLKDAQKQPASTIDTIGNLQLSSQEKLILNRLNSYADLNVDLLSQERWLN